MRRLKRSADCARNSQPEYDHSGVPDTVPLSADDRALLSGLRRNDEFAVLTGQMTGDAFDAAAEKIGGLRQKLTARV